MNIIISFAGLENNQSSVPYPLRPLAGSTILGHVLARLLDYSFEKIILVVGSGLEEVEGWIREKAPDLPLTMILAANAKGPAAALVECKELLDHAELLFVAGNYISEINFEELRSTSEAALCLIQGEQDGVPAELLPIGENGMITSAEADNEAHWAGSCWFRHGADLLKTLDLLPSPNNRDWRSFLVKLAVHGLPISTWKALNCLDTRSVKSMLHANARLLRLDHGSQDAIERSYAEDFTVLPPVFLHETAVIENSVIGPFVNLEADAAVRNSIVRNSLIGTGTQIGDAILADSIIGSDTVITGQRRSVIVGDGANINLAK